MTTTVLAALGVTAGVLQIVSIVPYVRDIFGGKTKPERATWWIWSLLTAVSLGAQIGGHAKWSLWMTAGQGLGNLLIALLSLTRGYGRFGRKDVLALGIAAVGVVLWWLLQSPLLAIIAVLIADLVGFWLTIEKTWRRPRTETESAWVIMAVSSVCAVLAVGRFNVTQLLYPFYILCGNGVMIAIIILRRQRRTR